MSPESRSFRRLRALLGAGLALAALSFSTPALAASNDEAAEKLAEDAIFNDYLALEIDKALKKLEKAIDLCANDKCSDKVQARLFRDLGIVYVAGKKKREDGKSAFVQALVLDPKIMLDPDLSTPEIESAWKEAKAIAAGKEEAPPPPEKPKKAPPEKAKKPPAKKPKKAPKKPKKAAAAAAASAEPLDADHEEEMVHSPPPEQAVMTPLPLYMEPLDGDKPATVKIRYKAVGGAEWKTLLLKAHEQGFAGEIACAEVGSTPGTLTYYVQALDKDGEVAAASGSRGNPHVVEIRTELEGDAPTLPGKPAPEACAEANDCPPDFPGCGAGAAAELDEEPEEPSSGGLGFSLAPTLAFQQDFLLFPGADAPRACTEAARLQLGLTCYYGGGTYRDPAVYGEPLPNVGGRVSGGPAIATQRILAGVDVNGLFFSGLSLGLRGGFALGGGPTAGTGGVSFLPIHAEARVGYYFLGQPFRDLGPHPFAAVAGGLAQVDARVNTHIGETCDPAMAGCNADGRRDAEVQVWTKSGTFFLAPTAGLYYAIAKNHGPYVEAKALIMLGTSGFGFAATLGYSYGFEFGGGPTREGPPSILDDSPADEAEEEEAPAEEAEEADEGGDEADDSGWE